MQVLVLNQTYEPLQFCNPRRAVVLLLSGKAEQLEPSNSVFRSPSLAVVVPAVIRLLSYIRRPYLRNVAFNKRNIMKRDSFTCQYCGGNGHAMTIDHVIPKSNGGKTVWENVVCCCPPCNLRKANKTIKTAQMKLIRHPTRPKSMFYLNLSLWSSTGIWARYLPPEFQISLVMEDN